jgi:hypothetical protein
MAIIGVVLGGIVAGVLTGGAAFLATGAAISAAAAAGTAYTGLSAMTAGLIWGGSVALLTIAGGTLSTVDSWSGGSGGGSPTYSWGRLQTQTNNCLAIPIIYGECKVAGNTIRQSGAGTTTLQKIIALADGEIEAITDVRINNKAISSLPGCSNSNYIGTPTQLIDSRVTGSTNAQRAEQVGGLRNTAYIALTAKASNQLSGGVNLTTIVKGSKVKIYSDLENYNIEYSNNPAWCILDFLTRYNGSGLPLEEIDLQSFIDAAAYCDEEVDGQKRFTLNLVLDTKKSRLDWLENMLITCRGYTFYQNGKLSLQIEKAENTMQVFDKDNILAGSEKFWTTPREKKVDIFKVQYIDPQNEYARIFAHAEADEFENEQPIVQEIQAWGVTNFNQASRLAWYYLNQSKTCDKFISFSTSQEGLDRTIGDVVEITSTFLGYEEKKMRIIHMSEAQEGQIEIVCKEYNEELYSDQCASANPVVNTITLPNAFDIPPTPQNLIADENCWRTPEGNFISTIKVSWDELDYFHLSHYEISYSNDGGESWSQGNISYDNNFVIQNSQIDKEYLVKVYAVTRKDIFSEPAEASVVTVGKNSPPERVQKFIITQKDDYLKAIITPPDDEDISHYEIRLGSDWETSEFVLRTIETSAMFRATQSGTVCYLVKAVDNVGNYSDDATRFVLNISNIAPKNIVVEQTFTSEDFTQENEFIVLPQIDLGVNFEDYRNPKETRLIIECENATEIQYRHAFAEFQGWDYLTLDEDNWEDDAPLVWSEWKNYTQEPEFCGQCVQVRVKGENIEEVKIIADVEDIEDTVSNIAIPNETTRVWLNKSFNIVPTVIPTTVDTTGKVCAWRLGDVGTKYFDIELLDNEDNTIAGKLLCATVRGY